MKAHKLQELYLLLFCLLPIAGLSQGVEITTTSLQIVDKKLQISYDFIKSKQTQRFEVWVEISNSSGKDLNAKTFSGDVGENITGGKNKKIIWDYNADGIVLDDEINVKVNASIGIVEGAVKPGKLFFKSLIIPGWGLSSINNEKPYWLMGATGYAAFCSSLLLGSSSNNNYDKYLDSTDPDESSNFYNKSQSQNSLSQVFSYVAIGTWAVSSIWTIVKANKVNKSLIAKKENRQFYFYSGYDPVRKTAEFTLRYNF